MNWLLRKLLGRPTLKTCIDLKAFLLEGKMLGVELGQTKQQVLSLLPKPDDFEEGNEWKNGEFEIFSYGDLELHFSNGILYLIFADFEGALSGGKILQFTNKWLFNQDTSELNLAYVLATLQTQNIPYTTHKNEKLQTITLCSNSNVEIQFETGGPIQMEAYRFIAFSLSDMPLIGSA